MAIHPETATQQFLEVRAHDLEQRQSTAGYKRMNIQKMLTELHEERRRLSEAITRLEGLAATGAKRRGRPPKWLVAIGLKQELQTKSPARKKTAQTQRKRRAAYKKP